MVMRFTRRRLLKSTALAAGASLFPAPALLAERSPNAKINFAVIGCGGRSTGHLPVAASERLVAVADADERQMASALKWLGENAASQKISGFDAAKVERHYDYRWVSNRKTC